MELEVTAALLCAERCEWAQCSSGRACELVSGSEHVHVAVPKCE